MDARSTLRPGKKGTKKLVARFGDRLICVRYRYDAQRRKRFTTVELIVDEADWHGPTPTTHKSDPPVGPVAIKVEMWESAIQRKVRAAGGTWDRARHVWLLPLPSVRALNLTNRIVEAPGGEKFMLLET